MLNLFVISLSLPNYAKNACLNFIGITEVTVSKEVLTS